jgi:rhodanese-related sulfurtransferase
MDKSVPVFVYCKSGRSQKAAEKLNELGFTTIYQLEGGILKWEAAGL